MKKLIQRMLMASSMGALLIAGPVYGNLSGYRAPTQSSKTQSDAYSMGMEEIKEKDYAQASGYFKAALEKNPEDADAANMLGYSERMQGHLDNALKAYAQALQLRPRFPAAREYLGETYIQAALEQIKSLKEYGAEGAKEYQDLTQAFQAAAKTLSN